MSERSPAYVLDSFALLAYFQAETGGAAVRALIEAARDRRAILHLSLVNAGEIYYLIYRHRGSHQAETLRNDLHDLPVSLYLADEDRVFAAARFKAGHAISYADAFAVALALELNATLVTGDPELKSVESEVRLMWLPVR